MWHGKSPGSLGAGWMAGILAWQSLTLPCGEAAEERTGEEKWGEARAERCLGLLILPAMRERRHFQLEVTVPGWHRRLPCLHLSKGNRFQRKRMFHTTLPDKWLYMFHGLITLLYLNTLLWRLLSLPQIPDALLSREHYCTWALWKVNNKDSYSYQFRIIRFVTDGEHPLLSSFLEISQTKSSGLVLAAVPLSNHLP